MGITPFTTSIMVALPLFLIFTSIFLLFLACYKFISKSITRTTLNVPPGSFGWPFIGETLSFLRAGWEGTPEKFIKERVQKHGNPLVFKTSILGDKTAVLLGPAGNKFLFTNENKLVVMYWPMSVRKLFGQCLLTCIGDEAKWTRKILLSYLGPEAVSRSYTAAMDTVTRLHLQTYWLGKEEVNVFKTVKLHTFELACRLFMSLEDPKQIEKLFLLFNIFLKGVLELPINCPGTRFYAAKRAGAAIRTELLALLKQRKVELKQNVASPSKDLLSHLLTFSDEQGRFMPDMEIINNILLLLFGGHDTSTVSITLLMKCLGEHPEVYEKVLREQLEIAVAKAPGEMLKWEDLQKMRYSWNVVSEVMRIIPPITGTFREALVDIDYAGYTIPKGWKLYWQTAWTHKLEEYFPNATNFDVSRFGGTVPPTPYSYVPFGGGPRMCVGQEFARFEILVFLHNVITKFKWDLKIPDEKIGYDPMPTPVKGLPILLHPH